MLPLVKGIPVIIVSAKIDVKDKVDQLLAGAVDYVTKPFEIEELLARIKVQLRLRSLAEKNDNGILKIGDISLDLESMTAGYNGKKADLTRTETAILRLLIENAGKPMGRNTILERISE